MNQPGSTGHKGSGLPVGDLLTDGPITVDLATPASALAIGAHPDDIELGCGATLAKWAEAGCRVHHLVLTDGSKGSWDPDADLTILIADRAAECRRAAEVIGGHRDGNRSDRVLFLGGIDGELVNQPDTRRKVARILRTLCPEIVLGHDPWRRYRLHPDHRAAGFLTVDALVAARDPHFFPELELRTHRPAHLLLWEADLPNHVESTGRFESTKVEALWAHASQRLTTMGVEGEGEGDAAQLAPKVRHQLGSHGSLAGLPSGEAFRLMSDL